MAKTKIIFMGTPEIAVPTLIALNGSFNIAAVVTVPDKPQGRGMCLTASPVKKQAQMLDIEVLQPESLSDINFIDKLQQIAPDIIVVFAFRFLPKAVYGIAKIAAFNIHTSLLPDYRGAAPVNWAIINGETTTGLTAFMLEDKIDGGPIIAQQKIPIPLNCTATELHKIMSFEAPEFAIDTCRRLLIGNYTLQPQQSISTKFAPKIYKHTAEINWQQQAQFIVNFINGYSQQPCAWTIWNGRKLQILRAQLQTQDAIPNSTKELNKCGDFCITQQEMLVRCGDSNVIKLMEIKPENKKAVLIKDFINGHKGAKQGSFLVK